MKALLAALLLLVATPGVSSAPPSPAPPLPSQPLPHSYDVVVVGSTPAGIAAALAAARRGLRVAYLTRHTELGGELTLGMLSQWDVKNPPHGGELNGGIFKEFYDALPSGFEPSYAAAYFRRRIEDQPGIEWHAGVRDIQVDDERDGGERRVASMAYTLSDGSRAAVTAPCFIDATEDGDVAAAAGGRYDIGRQDAGIDTRMQPVTLVFSLAGVNWERVLSTYDSAAFGPGGAEGRQAWGYSKLMHRYRSLSQRAIVRDANFQLRQDGTVMVNAVDVLDVDGRHASSVAAARAIAESESRHFVEFLRGALPGFEHAHIAQFAEALYVRETRHVRGLVTINGTYIWDGEQPYDTIALAAYPLDVHPVSRQSAGGNGWAPTPHVYGVPLRALVVYGLRNLAIVGPAISATHTASGSLRVLPTTIAEGEAAGAACAVSVRQGQDLQSIATSKELVRLLQRNLAAHGAIATR